MTVIRRLRADEWQELRELRLRALADAPQAFAFTLGEAERQSDAEWRDAAHRGAAGDRQSTFVADEGGRFVGMAIGRFPDPDDPELVNLIAMWVDPMARRKGLGTRLVNAVLRWAAERGARTVRLGVNESDERAVAFYRALGFKATGRREAIFAERGVLISDEPISGYRFVAMEMEASAP